MLKIPPSMLITTPSGYRLPVADVYGVVDAPLLPLRWMRSIKRPPVGVPMIELQDIISNALTDVDGVPSDEQDSSTPSSISSPSSNRRRRLA
jgi:hypothetical protein